MVQPCRLCFCEESQFLWRGWRLRPLTEHECFFCVSYFCRSCFPLLLLSEPTQSPDCVSEILPPGLKERGERKILLWEVTSLSYMFSDSYEIQWCTIEESSELPRGFAIQTPRMQVDREKKYPIWDIHKWPLRWSFMRESGLRLVWPQQCCGYSRWSWLFHSPLTQ